VSFGESFECLTTSSYHHWIVNVLRILDFTPIFRGLFTHPITFRLIALLFMSKEVRNSRETHIQFVRERLQQRIDNKAQHGRSDFVDSMMRHGFNPAEGGMTFDEMKNTCTTLVLAGSETTATLLSGCTYQLLTHPDIYEKVKAEIRARFNTPADITFASVQECEYMNAVLEESLRVYPPAPAGFARIMLEDTEISGVKLPKGTLANVHQLSTYRASENWRKPYEFIPERFLKEGKEGEFKDDGKLVII
jgi:cytochrome P450